MSEYIDNTIPIIRKRLKSAIRTALKSGESAYNAIITESAKLFTKKLIRTCEIVSYEHNEIVLSLSYVDNNTTYTIGITYDIDHEDDAISIYDKTMKGLL